MRGGPTLNDAFIILDEAQNATHAQMKMFFTRMGKNVKFIVIGDPSQVDLPPKELSGLSEALNIQKAYLLFFLKNQISSAIHWLKKLSKLMDDFIKS